jgi:hypothetical protein
MPPGPGPGGAMEGRALVLKFLLLILAVAACAGALHVGTAQAISPCGSFTSSTTLTADCAAPLLVGGSGITIDLGGHSVVCDVAASTGVLIPFFVSSSTLRNGAVRGGLSSCVNDIQVDGSSNNVTSVRAFDASNQGIEVTGDSNTLLLVTANGNDNDGLIVFGDNNTIRQGTFAANGDDGASFFTGSANAITRSRTFLNAGSGIILGANNSVASENHSFFNTTGIKFTDGSSGSVAVLNQTYRNSFGIWVKSSMNDSIVFNGSYANFIWDMEDDNANCDGNLWFNNLFSTANQACIN